jgi:hypothetical protein
MLFFLGFFELAIVLALGFAFAFAFALASTRVFPRFGDRDRLSKSTSASTSACSAADASASTSSALGTKVRFPERLQSDFKFPAVFAPEVAELCLPPRTACPAGPDATVALGLDREFDASVVGADVDVLDADGQRDTSSSSNTGVWVLLSADR